MWTLLAWSQAMQRGVGGHMGWGGWGMMLVWLVVLVLVIVLVWGIARGGWSDRDRDDGEGRDRAERILRERYARGEIDEETYRRRMDELRRD